MKVTQTEFLAISGDMQVSCQLLPFRFRIVFQWLIKIQKFAGFATVKYSDTVFQYRPDGVKYIDTKINGDGWMSANDPKRTLRTRTKSVTVA